MDLSFFCLFLFVCLPLSSLPLFSSSFLSLSLRAAKNIILYPPCFSFARSSLVTTFEIWIVISLPFIRPSSLFDLLSCPSLLCSSFLFFRGMTSLGFDFDTSLYSTVFITLYPHTTSLYFLLSFPCSSFSSCLYIAFKVMSSFVLNGYSLSEITFIILLVGSIKIQYCFF